MFAIRKEYPLSGNNKAVGYEVTDKYAHTIQITPLETEDLMQWLVDRKKVIHKDVHGEIVVKSSLTEELLIELAQARGLVVLDDWEGYSVCRLYDETTMVFRISKSVLARFTPDTLTAILDTCK